ncbi:hypothetical protein [Natrarchaeobius chitinivorans]|uniref:Uncharacterized protein n=1 Tax=Natrarchaeobius chitinivorans TaxID=1679083 RepID=A0A3N6M038_NATCH|nr:hypothetical protein [Natrarchaeobius chitinivorans]RQG96573.1 hypothetical protein EA473_05535 [Natrarchaeobius chitinivorans]
MNHPLRSDGVGQSRRSTSRRGLLAGLGTTAVSGFAGCSSIIETVWDPFEEFNVGNHGGETVTVSTSVVSPDGDELFAETTTYDGGEWDGYEDVWERTGEHTISFEVEGGRRVSDDVPVNSLDDQWAVTTANGWLFVYSPGDFLLTNYNGGSATVDVRIEDPNGEPRLDQRVVFEKEGSVRFTDVWERSGEHLVTLAAEDGPSTTETMRSAGSMYVNAIVLEDDEFSMGWDESALEDSESAVGWNAG